MKNIIALAILQFAFAAFAVTIPLASPRQIAASPLERGEVARVERGGYAELYVGGQTGPLRVTDGSALRGYRVRTLDPSEYSVSASSGFTHNIETGTYTATQTGQTNTIIITAKDGVTVEHVGIASEFTGEGLMPGEFIYVTSEYNGNAYRWEAAFAHADSLVVKKITVQARDIGEIDWINDTENITFNIRDALGQYNLFDLRKFLLHYYDGNRGENWSFYKAYKPIRLDGEPIRFTEDNRFTVTMTAKTNFVLQADMKSAVEVNIRTNAPIHYTTFSITAIDVGSANQGDPIVVDFTTDIEGFDAANLGVKVCSELNENVWFGLPESDFVVSDIATSGDFTTGTVTIPNGIRGTARFVRLMYGAAASETIDLVLHGRVIIKDLLIIKGTDSKFYRININGGTISATEVTL